MAHVRERPPLRVTIDIETPGGKHYRWAEDEPAPENVPSGLTWSDTMPGGFETMDCVLPRKPGIDYSDLEQLSTIRVLGAGGGIAGEYRLERSPRTSGDEVAISPGAVGWQAHLEDDKSAKVIYIDQDMTHWGEMTLTRKAALAGSALSLGDFSWSSGPEGVVVELPNQALGGQTMAELDYLPGAGVLLAFVVYQGANVSPPAYALTFKTLDDAGTFQLESYTPTNDNTLRQITFTPNRRNAAIQLYSNGTAVTPTAGALIRYSRLVVHGDHGLTPQQVAGDVSAYFASQIVGHAVSRWAPLLTRTTESVQASGFVVPHMVFLEPTTAGEIVRQATRFGLQDWAVWDNKTFWWHERGAFSNLWRSRVAPAQLDETGPQVDRLWESIIVQYQDVDGSTKTVGPVGSGADVEDASLKDTDPDNPANQLGITRRDILQMGTSTSAGAIEVGRRFLEESQLLDRSGRARVVGHVEDSSGVLHPYWRPRAGDYISFIDAADTSYRRIVRTQKSHGDRTCNLDLDAPPEGLKALLERLGVVLVPLGLS